VAGLTGVRGERRRGPAAKLSIVLKRPTIALSGRVFT
jgi:hypothetical protein